MDFLSYVNAVRKHWWVLMSSAVFTGIGMWIAFADKNNAWAFKTMLVAGGLLLLWACFSAWQDEHNTLLASEAENRSIRDEYFDERPRIGFRIRRLSDPPRRGEIFETRMEVEFSLCHLSGRPATSVSVDSLDSRGGMYAVHFNTLPYLANHAEETVGFEVWRNGQRPSRKLIENIGWGKIFSECLFNSPRDESRAVFL
jgi:hypothetical protein